MIIAVEGIDGAGKNTLVGAVKDQLGAQTLSFPRYSESVHAQLAREALHGNMGDVVDSAYGMAILFALDRAGAKPLLDTYSSTPDKILILDRYVSSNAAYTLARTGDSAALSWVSDLEFGRFELPVPDLQVLVDTSPQEADNRARSREEADASRTRDSYERDSALQKRTFDAYAQLAGSNWASQWVRAHDPATILHSIQGIR